MFGPEQLTPLGPYERAQSSHEIASQRCVLTESVHGGPFLTKCLYIFHKVCMSRIIIAECATTLIHVRLNANLDVCASDLYATSRHTSDIFWNKGHALPLAVHCFSRTTTRELYRTSSWSSQDDRYKKTGGFLVFAISSPWKTSMGQLSVALAATRSHAVTPVCLPCSCSVHRSLQHPGLRYT